MFFEYLLEWLKGWGDWLCGWYWWCFTLPCKRNPFVEFFYECNDEGVIYDLVDEMMSVDKEKTIKMLWLVRDPRNGTEGLRDCFFTAYTYLYNQYPEMRQTLIQKIWVVPEVGRWKDLVELYHYINDKEFREEILEYFDNTLRSDLTVLQPSMCAKWVPSEGKKYDYFTRALARYMQLSLANLRKQYLSPLRKRLDIVEREICNGSRDEMVVPNAAARRYFNKNVKNCQWNQSLTSLCKYYLLYGDNGVNNDIEEYVNDSYEILDDTKYNVAYTLQTINEHSLALGIFGSHASTNEFPLLLSNGYVLDNYTTLHDKIKFLTSLNVPRAFLKNKNFVHPYSTLTPDTLVVVTNEDLDVDTVFVDGVNIVWWNVTGCPNVEISQYNNITCVRGNHPYLMYAFFEDGYLTRESYLNFLLKNVNY